MKSIKLLSILAISALSFVSCEKDEPMPKKPVKKLDPSALEGDITTNYTLKEGVEYKLTGSLYVKKGATLTIEPGVIVKAEAGGTDVFLAVERGAKLVAAGTKAKPIEFKSASATPGTADWGGVVIAGFAKTNKGEAETEVAGLKYGGTNDADNSGILTYVKMAHTGAKINGDAEFNGLSLYSVGSGTKIENIFISNGADDGIEFFGGTVNVTNLMCVNIKDDMFDFTGGYTGTITNAFGVREAGFNEATDDPRGIEGDSNGSDNAATPVSAPTFNGVTVLNLSSGQKLKAGAEIRRGTKATIKNALFAAVEGAKFGALIDAGDKKGCGELTISSSYKYGEVGSVKLDGKNDKKEVICSGVVNGTDNIVQTDDALTVTGDAVTIKSGLGADFSKFAWTGYTELKK